MYNVLYITLLAKVLVSITFIGLISILSYLLQSVALAPTEPECETWSTGPEHLLQSSFRLFLKMREGGDQLRSFWLGKHKNI